MDCEEFRNVLNYVKFRIFILLGCGLTLVPLSLVTHTNSAAKTKGVAKNPEKPLLKHQTHTAKIIRKYRTGCYFWDYFFVFRWESNSDLS